MWPRERRPRRNGRLRVVRRLHFFEAMRTWTIAALLATVAPAAADDTSLSAKDVRTELAPVHDAIEHCYLDRTTDVRGAGQLELVLTISRHGILEQLDVKTPKLSTKTSKDIDACIRTAVGTITFPVRRTWTTATVPYFFQRTAAPDAGPQLSCWSASGCPSSTPSKRSPRSSGPTRTATGTSRYSPA